MEKDVARNQFLSKFSELSEHNQKQIVAIQQALLYTQTVKKAQREKTVGNRPAPSIYEWRISKCKL